MALNVVLPMSGLPELLYPRCALISPLPLQEYEENLELLVTPYGSSESGIGSDDSNESKVRTVRKCYDNNKASLFYT